MAEVTDRGGPWNGRPMAVRPGAMALATVAFAAIMASCHSDTHTDNSQLANGWVTNCAGPEFSSVARTGSAGSGTDRPVFRINDQLVLAVPMQNWPSTRLDGAPRICRQVSDLPQAPFLYFVMSGSWSKGYKAEDIPIVGGNKQFQPDVVTVRIEREIADTRSVEEQQKIRQMIAEVRRDNSIGTREVGGLTCFVPKPAVMYFSCSGNRSKTDPDVIWLRYRDHPGTPF